MVRQSNCWRQYETVSAVLHAFESDALKSLINLVSCGMLGKMQKQRYCERAFLNVNLIAHKKIFVRAVLV